MRAEPALPHVGPAGIRRKPPLSVHELELTPLYSMLKKGSLLRLYAHGLVKYMMSINMTADLSEHWLRASSCHTESRGAGLYNILTCVSVCVCVHCMHVCVCVCVERERERQTDRQTERDIVQTVPT